ncbi:MAG: NAD-dependent epimerase/dehydratase family protein [Myxococcales bacterium]|nr:NAD-dependent epimerase/dehydratase family protein [Myxococcales bacterium]
MTILVTGGGGFIGRSIVRALLDRGERVRVLCRGDYPLLRNWGVDLQRGDIRDQDVVAAAVEGCDGVFHNAAHIDLWGPYETFFDVNTLGTRHVIAGCKQHRVPKLVYTSTPSVVHSGDAVSGVDESAPYSSHFEAHYPATKALAEQEVLAANAGALSTVAIRPHLVWGPGDSSALPRLVARAKAGRLRMVGRPQQIDTTYIDNAVAAHLSAYDRLAPGSPVAGKAYFITQGEPLEGPTFINDMLDAVGLPPVTRVIPAPLARSAAAVAEAIWNTFKLQSEPPVTRFLVSQLSTAHWYDISAARRDLGYDPAVSYAEGMVRLKAWARSQTW